MSTFDNRKSVDQFIKNEDWLDSCLNDKDAPDNPPAVRIVEYENAWGKVAYGVTFQGDRDKYKYDSPSEYIRNPHCIWERPSGPRAE